MKKVINLLGAILITGSITAQWTYKVSNNGFDDPYKIAYTEVNNNAFLKMENVDSSIVLYVQGGYYCDEKPTVDVVFVVNGTDKKYKFIGNKSQDNSTVFISWYFDLYSDAVVDFKAASSIRIRINESFCTSEIYNFNMGNSKAAYDFMIK
ncbi:MAG: hypothetical protein RLZZ196_1916 [Bacteroidota bacterium]|jgi:hypothetical protein